MLKLRRADEQTDAAPPQPPPPLPFPGVRRAADRDRPRIDPDAAGLTGVQRDDPTQAGATQQPPPRHDAEEALDQIQRRLENLRRLMGWDGNDRPSGPRAA